MRYSLISLLVLLFSGQTWAFDTTTQGVVASLYVTSKITTGPLNDKRVQDAQDDAAAFVATGGALRGARLEEAFRLLKNQQRNQRVSDLELAQAILVQ